MRSGTLALILLLAAFAAASPAAAQLDGTWLLPEDAWEAGSFHAPEGAGGCEIADGTARVSVTALPADAWGIGFGWNTITPIAAGDVLLLSFEARAEGEANPPGKLDLAFRRTTQPYLHSLNDELALSGEWREYHVPFAAAATMESGAGTLRLNLGTQLQTLDLSNLSLVNLGAERSLLAVCRMLGIDPGSAGAGAVGTPLRPDLLWEMAAFDQLPAPDPQFDPSGAWVQTWRIWTCYGYLLRSNQSLGVLRIEREPTGAGGFRLAVEQTVVSAEGQQHLQSAQITCAGDALASPRRWSLATRFLDPAGEEIADLSLARTVDTPPEGPATADWCLFEAVQRLPFSAGATLSFDLLEGLSLPKAGHELRYIGPEQIAVGDETRTLHHFQQIGHGTLPCDWWLDESHRVVLMVSAYRVYVLDPAAEEAYAATLAAQVTRYERLQTRRAEQEGETGE